MSEVEPGQESQTDVLIRFVDNVGNQGSRTHTLTAGTTLGDFLSSQGYGFNANYQVRVNTALMTSANSSRALVSGDKIVLSLANVKAAC